MMVPKPKHKRRPLSPAHKRAISVAQTGRPGYWTGKKMPATAIEKMRAAKEGRTLPLEHRQRIGEGGRNKIVSEETRAKLREFRHTEASRKKMSQSQAGEKARLWKGGVSTPTQIARAHLKFWRKTVLERDGHRCQWPKCGATESRGKRKALHAHHVQSFNDYPELRYDPDNGITLCLDHHIETERQARLARR